MKTLKIFLFAFATLLISCGDKALIVTEDVKPTLPAQPYDYDNLALPVGTAPAGSTFNQFEFINGVPVVITKKTEITPWGATLEWMQKKECVLEQK